MLIKKEDLKDLYNQKIGSNLSYEEARLCEWAEEEKRKKREERPTKRKKYEIDLFKLLQEGMHIKDAAKKINITVPNAYKWRRREILRLINNDKKSNKYVADLYNLTERKIELILEKHNK